MDPSPVGASEWSEIGSLLTNLWIVVFLIVTFAGNMIVGHSMLPSLLATRDVPDVAERSRPIFYALAVISLGLALFFLARAVGDAGVLGDIWSDYWI